MLLLRSESNRVISMLLSITSGVMISIVCFELMEESIEAAQTFAGDNAVFVVKSCSGCWCCSHCTVEPCY